MTLRGQMEPPFKAFDGRRSYWVYLFARLNPGETLAEAGRAVNATYHGIITTTEVPLQNGMSPATLEVFRNKVVTLTPAGRSQGHCAFSVGWAKVA